MTFRSHVFLLPLCLGAFLPGFPGPVAGQDSLRPLTHDSPPPSGPTQTGALELFDDTKSSAPSQPPLRPSLPTTQEVPSPFGNSPGAQVAPEERPSLPPITDTSLEPASWNQPASSEIRTAQNTSADPQVAKYLLTELQHSATSAMQNYQPMGMQDMLVQCPHHRRKDMVRQYWIAWRACTDYLFACDETRWVDQLGQPRDQSERLVLDAARATVADAMREKELAMIRELRVLNGYLSGPVSEQLPWPVDMPMVGTYRTHYEAYAAAGLGSEPLRVIHEMLPLQQALIASRADTVQRCSAAIQHATHSYNQAGSGSATMLQALYLSRESHGAFSRTVADYNHRIADYALTLKPAEQSEATIAAMLLPRRTTADSLSGGDPGLRQAALPQEPGLQPESGFREQGAGMGMTNQGSGTMNQGSLQPAREMPFQATNPSGVTGSGGFQSGPPVAPSPFRR